MNKTMLIITREYLTRVRKKSFIILTILVPLLIVGMYAAIFMFAMAGAKEMRHVIVLDESNVFAQRFNDTDNIRFTYAEGSLESEKEAILKQEDHFLLHIAPFDDVPRDIELISPKQAGMNLIERIDGQMENILRDKRLVEAGIDTAVLNSLNVEVYLHTHRLTEKAEPSTHTGASYGVALTA